MFTYFIVSLILYLLSTLNISNFKARFRFLRSARREFYECGCRPHIQKPFTLSLQFLIICIFFLIYDVELLFSFPLISMITSFSFFDFFLFLFLYGTLVISLLFDYSRFLTKWRV